MAASSSTTSTTPNTVPLRLNGSLSYSNLWQLGHTIRASFQVAPEKQSDGTVLSAYYQMPLENEWSVMVTGAWQDSSISTLGGGTVVGKGQIYGVRFMKTLPAEKGWFPSGCAHWQGRAAIAPVAAGRLAPIAIRSTPRGRTRWQR